jgi:quercetin dioxygenase-like cupin family protein
VLSPTIFLACGGSRRTAGPAGNGPGEAVAAATDTSPAPAISWGPAPAVFPPGAQMAVVQGDPSSAGLFIVRLRFPSGYRIAPHTHPTDEHITVLGGTFLVGMGATRDEAAMTAVPTGGAVTAPAQHAHYAEARGATTVQINSMGPFALTYVNPADLPKQASR